MNSTSAVAGAGTARWAISTTSRYGTFQMCRVRPMNARPVTVPPASATYSSSERVTDSVYGVTRATRRAPSSVRASISAPEVVTDGVAPALVIASHIARSPASPPTKLPEVQA